MEIENKEEAERHWQLFLGTCKLITEYPQGVTLGDLLLFSSQIVDTPIVELFMEGRKLYITFKEMVTTNAWVMMKTVQEKFYGNQNILKNDCFSDLMNFYNEVNVAVQTLDYNDGMHEMWLNFKNALCSAALSKLNIQVIADYLDKTQRHEIAMAYGNVVECMGRNMSKIDDPNFWDWLSALCLTNKQLCEQKNNTCCSLKKSAGAESVPS